MSNVEESVSSKLNDLRVMVRMGFRQLAVVGMALGVFLDALESKGEELAKAIRQNEGRIFPSTMRADDVLHELRETGKYLRMRLLEVELHGISIAAGLIPDDRQCLTKELQRLVSEYDVASNGNGSL